MTSDILIRKFKASDLDECIALFRATVHSVNARDYSASQLAAWAPEHIDEKNWHQRLTENISCVAELENQIVGFSNITPAGYVDLLYVHKDFQRRGIAAALLQTLEESARQAGAREFSTEASITAKTFFESQGYHTEKENRKEFRGEIFTNFSMKKKLHTP